MKLGATRMLDASTTPGSNVDLDLRRDRVAEVHVAGGSSDVEIVERRRAAASCAPADGAGAPPRPSSEAAIPATNAVHRRCQRRALRRSAHSRNARCTAVGSSLRSISTGSSAERSSGPTSSSARACSRRSRSARASDRAAAPRARCPSAGSATGTTTGPTDREALLPGRILDHDGDELPAAGRAPRARRRAAAARGSPRATKTNEPAPSERGRAREVARAPLSERPGRGVEAGRRARVPR